MEQTHKHRVTMDLSGFVVPAEAVSGIVQGIRCCSTCKSIGDRIDGCEEPCALKAVANNVNIQGYRLKGFDAYRLR